MTIKEIADELNVSKPTVSKAAAELHLQPNKVSNRFVYTEEQTEQIKLQIMKNGETKKVENAEKSETEKSEKPQDETEKTLISILQTQITIMQEQLAVKDGQIAAQQATIDTLTNALQDTTEALKTAQALHAGTIQTALVERSDSVSDDTAVTVQQEQPKKLSLWERLFGSK